MGRLRPKPSPRPRIVLADDDAQVRKLFARKLESEGYEVIEAHTGKKALDSVRTGGCNLLILDLSMPGMDGFDVLRALHSEMPDLKVIVISGYMHGALLEAASFLGAMETLEKPTTPQLLADTVRRLLAEH